MCQRFCYAINPQLCHNSVILPYSAYRSRVRVQAHGTGFITKKEARKKSEPL